MSKLPFFKWYPADCDTDENVRQMTDAELGFYIRCLNHAWLNNGLPADPQERARALRTNKAHADRYWNRVGKCFETDPSTPGRLFNPRSKSEMCKANLKSVKAAESVKHRYDRRSNVALRASDSDSVHRFGSSVGESEGKVLAGPAWKRDAEFTRFAADYLSTGGAFIDLDFAEAFDVCWSKLDFSQKLERTAALNRHSEEYAADPRFVPRPLKFLQSEWARPVKPAVAKIPHRNDVRRAEVVRGLQVLDKIRGRA